MDHSVFPLVIRAQTSNMEVLRGARRSHLQVQLLLGGRCPSGSWDESCLGNALNTFSDGLLSLDHDELLVQLSQALLLVLLDGHQLLELTRL